MNIKILLLIILSTLFSKNQILLLEDCINISINNKISIKNNQYDLEITRQKLKESYGRILPSLSLNSNLNQSEVYIEESSYNSSEFESPSNYFYHSLGLSLSQNIYNGSIWWNTIKKSKNNIKIIEQLNRQKLINIILEVMVSYYNYLKSVQILEVSNSSLLSAKKQLILIQKKFELGSAKTTDLLKAKVRIGQIEIQRINNTSTLEIALRNLINSMGIIDKKMNFEIMDDKRSLSKIPDIKHSLIYLKENNPSILVKQHQLLNAEYSKKLAKGAKLPRIRLTASYNTHLNGINLIDKAWPEDGQLSTAISINLPIYSGNILSSRIKQTHFNILKEEIEYTELIQNFSVRLENYIDRLNNYNEILIIYNTMLESAEEDLKLIQEKYTLGSASILELLDAQTSSISAKSALISIKYDALIEEAQINALLGELDYNY